MGRLASLPREDGAEGGAVAQFAAVTSPLRIGVIIPTLNEAANLRTCIESLANQTRLADAIIVVDGNSNDDTTAVAQQFRTTVLRSPQRGRGLQVRLGVQSADADAVVVLHADMRLLPESLARIEAYLLAHPKSLGGCLGHRFDRRSLLLRAIEWYDWVRARWLGISYGDQVQFFRPAGLAAVGGFPDQSIMEDLELSLRLRRAGRPAYLGVPAIVSARRFERLGALNTVLANLRYRREYRRGGLAACEQIYRHYHGPVGD